MQKSILQHPSALFLEQLKGKLRTGADPDVLSTLALFQAFSLDLVNFHYQDNIHFYCEQRDYL